MSVPRYLLHHRHAPEECGVAFAAFRGHASPLRQTPTVASCVTGGHEIWWLVDAADRDAALAQLPHFVALRATATEIREVTIP
jgi:hypothetical protein